MSSTSLLVMRTLASFGTFFVTGLAVMIVPPTMLHLEALFNSSVSTVSLSILVRSSTYMVGCLLCGLLFDRVGRREIQLAVCLLLRMLLLGVCTFHTVGAYIASWGLFGIILGYMEAGINPYLLEVWQGRSLQRPVMQLVHMGWTIGAALSPILARPFLAATLTTTNTTAIDVQSNLTLFSAGDTTPSYSDVTVTSDYSDDVIGGDVSMVRMAYLLIMPTHFVVAAMFLLIAFCFRGKAVKHDNDLKTEVKVSAEAEEKATEAASSSSSSSQNQGQGEGYLTAAGRVVFLTLALSFFFSFASSDAVALCVLTPTATKAWGWPAQKSALISTVIFLGSILGRTSSVIASALVKPFVMMTANTTLVLAASVLLVYCQYATVSEYVLWAAFFFNGLGSSSMTLNFMLYVDRYIALTPSVTALILTFGGVTWIIWPYVSALLLENIGHRIVIWLILLAITVAMLFIVILACVVRKLAVKSSSALTEKELVKKSECKQVTIPLYVGGSTANIYSSSQEVAAPFLQVQTVPPTTSSTTSTLVANDQDLESINNESGKRLSSTHSNKIAEQQTLLV